MHHLNRMSGITMKDQTVEAVVDPGAAVSLVTLDAAKRLGLRISSRSRPLLAPLWPTSAPYQSIGRANIALSLESRPKKWIHAVVVGFKASWDILLGADAMKEFNIESMTPAMQRRSPGQEPVADHPHKQLDSAERAPVAVRAVGPEDYDPESTLDMSYPLLTESNAAPPIKEPVVSRPMRAKLGLPAAFFVSARDDDFRRWDSMYPAATQ
ncbi:hypothetical protein EV180_007375, partial [Coemansia sp. RSA 518]